MKAFNLLIAAALTVACASVSRADWSEDFTGGAVIQPWVFVDDEGNAPPDATNFDTSNEDISLLGLPSQLQIGNVDQFVAGIVGIAEMNPLPYVFSDVTVSARVRSLPNANVSGGTGLGNNDAFVFARVQPNLASYLLALDFGTGSVDLVRVNSGAAGDLDGLADQVIAGFDATQQYRLELTTIGTQLTGNVYDSSNGLLASVSAVDASYAAGFSGIGAALSEDAGAANTTLLAVAFDDVTSTTIPEPSTLALCGMAAAMLCGAALRRWQRSGSMQSIDAKRSLRFIEHVA